MKIGIEFMDKRFIVIADNTLNLEKFWIVRLIK